MPKPMKYKQGDIRADGFIFFGYKKNPNKPGKFYEWFLSPKVYHAKKDRIRERCRIIQAQNYRDPIKGPLMREAFKQAMRKKRKKYPELCMLISVRCKCKRLGIKINLDLSDIHIPAVCPALGIKLKVTKDRVGASSPTLDRINPTKGYVKGNVVVISHKANCIKSNATADEIMKVAKFVTSISKYVTDRNPRERSSSTTTLAPSRTRTA